MAKFRKRPVIVEAIQWFAHGDDDRVVAAPVPGGLTPEDKLKNCCGRPLGDHGSIPTLEGAHIVCPGDWIITGVAGECYPCKPDIFALTYEAVEV